MTIKVPAKYVDKEFRALGARVEGHNDTTKFYRFRDGTVVAVRRRINHESAQRIVRDAQFQYQTNRRRDPIAGEPVRGRRPVIDFARLEASDHAQERLALMRSQTTVEWDEILRALQEPDRVLYSEFHDSWAWVGHRIAVCVRVLPSGRQIISTIAWSDADLWDQFPRPEKAS